MGDFVSFLVWRELRPQAMAPIWREPAATNAYHHPKSTALYHGIAMPTSVMMAIVKIASITSIGQETGFLRVFHADQSSNAVIAAGINVRSIVVS